MGKSPVQSITTKRNTFIEGTSKGPGSSTIKPRDVGHGKEKHTHGVGILLGGRYSTIFLGPDSSTAYRPVTVRNTAKPTDTDTSTYDV